MNITLVLTCLKLSSLIYNETKVLDKFSLINSYEENSEHPKFLIAKKNEDIFVVIRGEASLVDLETIIDFMPVNLKSNSRISNFPPEFSGSFVTSSILKSAHNIIKEIEPEIINCSGKIIFTGHSYGGSVAAMAATLIRLNTANNKSQNQINENVNARTKKNSYNIRTFAITFGSYPCISPDLFQFTKKFVTGIVVNHDVFPSMNPKNINNILDSIVQRGTSQAKKGAAKVTMLFAQICQYFVNESKKNLKIDISRKSLEMTLKLVKTAPKAANIKMINAGIVYHIFDEVDASKPNKKKFSNLFKVRDDSDVMDHFENDKNIDITQFDEDVEYGSLLELLSGISDHYITSYRNVIEKSQNVKFPYYI